MQYVGGRKVKESLMDKAIVMQRLTNGEEADPVDIWGN